jgi:hypothetical protein
MMEIYRILHPDEDGVDGKKELSPILFPIADKRSNFSPRLSEAF